MRRKTGTILAAALLGGLLLIAAGCGGGGSSTPPTTNTNATTTSATTTSSSSSGLGSLASAANCRQLADLGSQFATAFTGKNANIQAESTLLTQFAAKTPSDIRPDFETIASAFSKIAGALKGVNLSSGQTPTAAQIAKLEQLASQINQTKVKQAAQHIQTWAEHSCKAG